MYVYKYVSTKLRINMKLLSIYMILEMEIQRTFNSVNDCTIIVDCSLCGDVNHQNQVVIKSCD